MKEGARQLQEFCRIVQGGRHGLTGDHFVSHGFPAFGAGGINGFLPTYEFDQPAVILSAIGARCGKCFYADGKWNSLANTQLILPDPRQADPRFLWHQLNDEQRWHRSGTGQPFIKPSDIKTHEVYLPPLLEQRRIAVILDEADALRTKRRAAIAELGTLTLSIFREMFGDPATSGETWPSAHIGEVADVQGGLQVTRKRRSHPHEAPYLRVANVHRGYLDLGEIKTIRVTDAEVARTRLVKDDLLIVEGHGNPAEIGRCALWDGSIPEILHQNHIIRARFDAAVVLPIYAREYLNSLHGRHYLIKAGKTTSGLNTISVSQVRGVPLTVPPIELQREFAQRIAGVDDLRSSHEESLSSLDALFASLQHRAFRGEF